MRRDDALAELTRRYFVSRGPATLKKTSGMVQPHRSRGQNRLEMCPVTPEHKVMVAGTYWFAPPPPRLRCVSSG